MIYIYIYIHVKIKVVFLLWGIFQAYIVINRIDFEIHLVTTPS